ncbi:MAG: sulfite exporter TauE/SafE family protein, partial [Candidatus Freyarchaeota archaeon]|nr:sulfite exporter TauE/SafE family protein [Candidatus Jordarchaeia archaeon]
LTPTQSTPQPFAKTELNMHVRAPDEWISPISIQFFEQHWVLGAGGGVMFLLVLIFVLKYPIHGAIGTSTLIMAITATSGAIGYSLNGNINLIIAVIVGAGTILGGRVGAVG